MYARPSFRPDGGTPFAQAARVFADHPFACLIAIDPQGVPAAVHTPVLVEYVEQAEHTEVNEEESGDDGVLRLLAHVARANPWWRHTERDPRVTAIAMGPHAPISSAWYAEPSAPTWNYIASHAVCRARTIHDESELVPFLDRLTRAFTDEPGYAVDRSVMDKLVRAIVGIELIVESADSVQKMSQNKSERTRASIIEHLEARDAGDDRAVAAIMREGR